MLDYVDHLLNINIEACTQRKIKLHIKLQKISTMILGYLLILISQSYKPYKAVQMAFFPNYQF